jgi:hypothetical protein
MLGGWPRGPTTVAFGSSLPPRVWIDRRGRGAVAHPRGLSSIYSPCTRPRPTPHETARGTELITGARHTWRPRDDGAPRRCSHTLSPAGRGGSLARALLGAGWSRASTRRRAGIQAASSHLARPACSEWGACRQAPRPSLFTARPRARTGRVVPRCRTDAECTVHTGYIRLRSGRGAGRRVGRF